MVKLVETNLCALAPFKEVDFSVSLDGEIEPSLSEILAKSSGSFSLFILSISCPLLYPKRRWLDILFGEVGERSAGFVGGFAGLELAVEGVDVLNEFAVLKVERNVLGQTSNILRSRCSVRHMECADDVEHIFPRRSRMPPSGKRPNRDCRKRSWCRSRRDIRCGRRCSECTWKARLSRTQSASSGVMASSFATVSNRSPFQESSISLSTVIISSYTTWVLRQTVQRSRRASLLATVLSP